MKDSFLRFPLTVFLTSRIAMGLIGWLGLKFVPELVVPAPERSLRDWLWLDALFRWDSGWYARIAADGYFDLQVTNFWPLLPALTRGVSAFGLPIPLAQIVVTAVCQFGALAVLFRLFTRLTNHTVAQWGVIFYAVFPFAFFQAVPYPEGMLTCFSAAAVLAAVERRPVLVAIFLSLAILARHVGAVTLIAIIPIMWQANREQPFVRRVLGLWPALAAPAVVLGWSWYLEGIFHVPFAFIKSRDAWGPMAYWSIMEWSAPRTHFDQHTFIVISFILAVGAIPLLTSPTLRWISLMGAVNMAFLWAVGVAALARYTSSVWPFFLGLGILAARFPNVGTAVCALSLSLQAMFFYLYTHQWWLF